MSAPVRSFVALLLDDEVRAAIAAELDQVRPLSGSVGWVAPQNLHLTLKFLGAVPTDLLASVEDALAEAVKDVGPFTLAFHGLGAFPGLARPRVLWVGVALGVPECRALAQRVEEGLARLGLPRESRPYTPHLTIGRVRAPRDLAPLQQAITRDAQKAFGRQEVRALSLMRSDLHPGGARYTELCAFPFKG